MCKIFTQSMSKQNIHLHFECKQSAHLRLKYKQSIHLHFECIPKQSVHLHLEEDRRKLSDTHLTGKYSLLSNVLAKHPLKF